MGAGKHCEIELKYLIRYPDTAMLAALPGCEVWEIEQVYLTSGECVQTQCVQTQCVQTRCVQTRRVRRVKANGTFKYYRTFKRFVSALSSEEDEVEITRAEYEAYLRERDPESRPILKTRWRVPYAGHVLEFDIYPFWTDRAVMEIELEQEDEVPEIPDYVRIIRNVTGELVYKNSQLARRVPMEAI